MKCKNVFSRKSDFEFELFLKVLGRDSESLMVYRYPVRFTEYQYKLIKRSKFNLRINTEYFVGNFAGWCFLLKINYYYSNINPQKN